MLVWRGLNGITKVQHIETAEKQTRGKNTLTFLRPSLWLITPQPLYVTSSTVWAGPRWFIYSTSCWAVSINPQETGESLREQIWSLITQQTNSTTTVLLRCPLTGKVMMEPMMMMVMMMTGQCKQNGNYYHRHPGWFYSDKCPLAWNHWFSILAFMYSKYRCRNMYGFMHIAGRWGDFLFNWCWAKLNQNVKKTRKAVIQIDLNT